MASTLVPDLLQTATGPYADSPAVLGPDGELSYRELWERVAAVAAQLHTAGIRPGDHVALHLPRSAAYVSALIATMAIGAVAIPLDPEFPAERRLQVVSAARPRVILHEGAGAPELRGTDGSDTALWLVPDTRPVPAAELETLRISTADSAELTAMMLFTSGSTGRPKGVRLHHAGLVNRLEWGHRRYGFDATDRVLHKASSAFDAAIHEIFSPLISGGTLVIAPPGLQFDSLGLVRLIQETEVTTAHFVPSVLRYVIDEEELAWCTSLRRVFCGGEALDMTLVRRFRALLPASLYNQYGPTETSVNATYWDCDEPFDGDIAPIGRPIDGVDCHVLDETMQPVPAGETGELWIGGVAVGGGYLDDAPLTAERFRPDPFTGTGRIYRTGDLVRLLDTGSLEFRGRLDDQVKVRGVRVEPGEVDSVLRGHPMVQDASVIAVPDEADGVRLVAYIAAKRAHAPVVDGLQRIQLPQGIAVATASPDEALFLHRQIFEQDEYARFGVCLGKDDVVVDIGANIGLFGLWAHRQAPGIRLVAVEPNPDTLPYLRVNLELGGVTADVVPAAVTDRVGSETLTSFPRLSYLSGLGKHRQDEAVELVQSHYRQSGGAGAGTEEETASLLHDAEERLRASLHEVDTTDLSSLLDRMEIDRVDLLKINTEGAELSVLRGIRPDHWKSIRQVCLEVERSSVVGAEIRSILEGAGFTVHSVEDWSVGTEADVTYVYATRDTAGAAEPATAPAAEPDRIVLTARELRRHAAERLPAAMQPSQFVFVEELPRLPNGKLARRELPAPPTVTGTAGTADGDGADTAVERMREIWREVLAVDEVMDDDDFVSLGGHSLLALRVSARTRRLVGTEVSPGSCLRAPSFAAWVAAISQPGAAAGKG
ncbi:Enterobactin synthase component F [Streptomyces lavendulae subsp. lavendulae]|uniref:Enterobactin synthase component F n=1 Tax=Streptomyces lavendulae subsp. lavendulae TaxID=58340 RepID=A0A2K8PS52_STRLA|nr:amino acid adenylation domain-containing protein [Streptomyces lavendulae]ATZ22052.1 Enterobactin synthase component F [Streptomyces lavendulae subsp. lavendulae]ATZ29519.1 Enterobactin synthase component F [Streptomyces lavendulae subsp. lavendulae]